MISDFIFLRLLILFWLKKNIINSLVKKTLLIKAQQLKQNEIILFNL